MFQSGGSLAEWGPLANTQKTIEKWWWVQTWDGYIKTRNHRKILQKTHKNSKLLKSKRILKPKYKPSGGPVFTFSLPGGAIHPSDPGQLRNW